MRGPSNCLICYFRRIPMPAITLPDGSQKKFDTPVSVAEVAASIGAGLAKAALAGRVNDKLVDTSFVITRTRNSRSSRRRIRRRSRSSAIRPRTCSPGRAGYLPEGAGHDRPGHRGRLLLRLRVRASLHARRSREDRSEDEGNRRGGPQGRAARHAARCGRGAVQEHGREVQGRDHRQHSRQRGNLAVRPGRVVRPVPRSARARPPASSRPSS